MRVISVLNQKGGSGKTTLSTNIARALQIIGNEVLIIDSDPQGSASDWYAAREEQCVPVISMTKPKIESCVKEVSYNKDYIIIDGAPQAHDLAISAIRASDLVLIPVQPSPYDVWASSELVEKVKQRIEITDGKLKAAFVISRAVKGTKIGSDIVESLADYNIPILTARTHHRVSYASSAARGETVFDDNPMGSAANEVLDIVKEMIILLA